MSDDGWICPNLMESNSSRESSVPQSRASNATADRNDQGCFCHLIFDTPSWAVSKVGPAKEYPHMNNEAEVLGSERNSTSPVAVKSIFT